MEDETYYQAMSKTELAFVFNVSHKTLNSWLKPFHEEIGEYLGRAYTPKQVRIIISKIGSCKKLVYERSN